MPNASESESTAESDRARPSRPGVADAVRQSAKSFAELSQYAGYLISAKIDQLRLSAQTLVIYAVLGVLGAFSAATVLIVAVVLLLIGLAHGLGSAMGGRDWLGDLIVSFIVLCGTALAMILFLARFKTASRRRTMRKYEDRRRQQREQFGHDVAERADR